MDVAKLRQQSRMLSTSEAAKVIAEPQWKVDRKVTLGAIAFNKLGNGTLVIHEVDLWKLTEGKDDSPAVVNGWFDTRGLMDARDFGPRCDATERNPVGVFGSRNPASGFTIGEAVLKYEAYSFARYHLKNGNQRYKFRPGSQGVESLYRVGPDAWRNFAGDCAAKLRGLTFALHGKRIGFSSCMRAGYTQLCERIVRESF